METRTTTMARSETRSLDACLGKRIRLEEYGCDEPFADLLPGEGVLVRRLEAKNGVRDWYLLELDRPFEHAGRRHTHLLIRPRRADACLAGREETSVFIVLAPNPAELTDEPIDIRNFDHVGYGITQNLSSEEARQQPDESRSVPRRKCHQCGHMYKETETHCTECGASRFNPLSAEITMSLKILLGLALLLVIAWGVVSLDPLYGRIIGFSPLWIKGLQVIGALAVILVVLDLVVRRVFRRRQ